MRMGENFVYLIGMSGAGKTSLGKLCADRLRLRFRDLDAEIEHAAGMEINTIFEKEGEAGLREREAAMLRHCGLGIIATGGGLVTIPENIRFMRDSGYVVYLRTSVERLIKNLTERGVESNPLLKGDFVKNAESLLSAREGLYESAAHVTVDVDCELSEAVRRLCAAVEEIIQ